jgi:hypothetical protein
MIRRSPMLNIAVVASVVIILCACSHSREPSQAVRTQTAFQFNIPVPVSFTVEEAATTGRREVRFRHAVRLERRSSDLVMRFTDFDLLTINSKIDAEEQARVEKLMRLGMLATPPAIITSSGQLTSCLNTSDEGSRFDKAWSNAYPERAASKLSVREVLGSEEGRKRMAELIRATYWAPWFEHWINWDLQPGEHRKTETQLTLNSGVVNAQVTKANWGSMGTDPRLVRLERTTIAYGPDVLHALGAELEALAQKAQKDESKALPEMATADYVEFVMAEIDPQTLKPLWVERNVTTTFKPASHNEEPVTTRETRKFTFNWSK